jgi:UDPglucose--hexose-1-phosphate uridylyltransferase
VPPPLIDELTGDQVILAPARALRPDTFRVTAEPPPARADNCPFCPGHESETPPEVARIGPGAPDTPGWRVRAVPNKYPIEPGAHEVVILSPAHDRDFGALDDTAAIESLTLLRDRAAFHMAEGAVYTQAFINSGKAAGASIEHPHAQLVALDAVPPRAQHRLDRFTNERFAADQKHTVTNGPVAVWCPIASTTPFALRAALPDAGSRFDAISDEDLRTLALALRDTLARVHEVLGRVAYNVIFETAPHWWLDIIPRVSVPAGFELGTGIWVNIVDPADAAAAYR